MSQSDKNYPTPRTDELAKRLTGGIGFGLLWEHARRLEWELAATHGMVELTARQRDEALASVSSIAPSAVDHLIAQVLAGEPFDRSVMLKALRSITVSAITPNSLDTAERVCFYEQEFYVLSNFSSFKLLWEGIEFDTSEAAYHWERFRGNEDLQNCVRYAPSAHEAFRFAQRCKAAQRKDWDEVKVEYMLKILTAKANQHEYVRRKLLETGDRELVENSWRDAYWGWGPNRDGLNMLGKLWMQVRRDLRRADDTGAKDG